LLLSVKTKHFKLVEKVALYSSVKRAQNQTQLVIVSFSLNNKVRCWQGTTIYVQISISGGVFSLIFGMRGRILMKHITVTFYRIYMTLMTFSRSWFKGQGHGQHFPKVHFSGGGIPIDSSPWKTIQLTDWLGIVTSAAEMLNVIFVFQTRGVHSGKTHDYRSLEDRYSVTCLIIPLQFACYQWTAVLHI